MRYYSFLSVLWVFCLSANSHLLYSKDKIVLLDDPVESLQIRMSLIKKATKTLDIATYIYGNDESSTQTVLEIIHAAERGVEVRIIVDALNNHLPDELIAYMISKGIRIKVFNPFDVKKVLNNVVRMHAKIIVCDKMSYIVGGRNIVNSYFYVGDQTNFKDREIYVSGQSGMLASKRFDDLWYSALMDEINRNKELSERKNLKILKEYFNGLATLPFLSDVEINKTLYAQDVHLVDDVNIIMDRPHSFKYTEKNTTNYILEKIKNARHEILIESPYLVLSKDLYKALQSAILRKVKVQIITNSMATSDSYLVLPVYFRERDQLTSLGFDILEFQASDQYLHTKMFLFDRSELAIGSYNMDNLSANINTEILVEVRDKKVISEALLYYHQTLVHSVRAVNQPLKPTLFEGPVNFKNLSKYGIIKLLEYTVAPYFRDYL